MNIKYREFHSADLDPLYAAFINSFSDYFVKFSPTEAQFKTRIFNKLNIRSELSALAMDGDRVLSFILHTINDYEGIRTAYNGGTGTIISARQRGLATKLYEFLLPRLKAQRAERILLEVVDKNHKGQELYESLGFQFTRVLKCFALKSALTPSRPDGVIIQKSRNWKYRYSQHLSYEPAFLDSTNQLKFNLNNEIILEAVIAESPVGHAIFQKATGRISQLAVHPYHRRKGLGKALIQACQVYAGANNLTIMNIPESDVDTTEALEAMGFRNELDQFELELII